MNIIYIAYSCNPYNGTEDKLGWYTPYYASKNNNVTIITKEESRESVEKFIDENKCNNINVHYIDIPIVYKKIYSGSFYSGRQNVWNKRAYLKAQEICRSQKIDLVHQITPVEFRSIGPYGKIENVPFVCGPIGGGEYIPTNLRNYVTGRGRLIEFIRLMANYYYKLKYKINGRFSECNTLLFANYETRDFLISPTKRDQYRVTTELGSLSQITTVSKNTNEIFSILAGGRLIYRKGFDLLFDAIETIPMEYDFNMVLVGDGPLYNHLKSRVNTSEVLRKRISILGKVPHSEMDSIYRASDLFIMPSLRETTGTVILEALENGVPVVTSNLFGAKTVLDDSCGILFDWENNTPACQTLANTIVWCIRNKHIISNMKQGCFKKAMLLSFENKIKQYQKIYMGLNHDSD